MEAALLSMLITAASAGGVLGLRLRGQRIRLPLVTLLIAAITFTVSAIGNIVPDVLDTLARDRDLLLDGEWWRLVTPLVVQDGGWVGTAFNIFTLLVLGTIVESLFDRRVLVVVYFSAGLVSELFAYTLLQNQGFAGNSEAVLGLAGLLVVSSIVSRAIPLRAIGAIGLVAGLSLVITANLHGVGFSTGAIIGGALAGLEPATVRQT